MRETPETLPYVMKQVTLIPLNAMSKKKFGGGKKIEWRR
jgi:hypothetical protein